MNENGGTPQNHLLRASPSRTDRLIFAFTVSLMWVLVYWCVPEPLQHAESQTLLLSPESHWLTFATSQLLHADWVHLLSNILFFMSLCGLVPFEQSLMKSFISLLLGGVVSTWLSFLISPAILLGASGGIASVFGTSLARFESRKPVKMSPMGIFVLGIIVALALPGDPYAHVGGVVFGFCLGKGTLHWSLNKTTQTEHTSD